MKLAKTVRSLVLCSMCSFFAVSAMAATTVVGSGASFPAPIYTTWFKQFSRANKGVQINYQAKGSGAGIRDFIDHTVDFAASDAAMTEKQIAKVPEGVQLLPMTAGEIVLAYNLKGVKDLQLSREAYTGIFLGKIKKWNDPVLVKANPGVTMPDEEITVVSRADSSGTSYVFTQHLAAISPEFAKNPGYGKTVNWPSAIKMVKAPKNDGVTATIKQTPGAIGYIEYGYAKMTKQPMAKLENKAGKFVAPGLEGGQAALANAKLPENMIAWITDPAGDQSYPIATYTWMMFYKKYSDPAKAEILRNMVAYCLDHGQKIADKIGYIPLPANVVEKVRAASANIQ
ncbi:phosphate ABC transporter substrate-binding protein PstS [Desulfobulbus rhabdoformis]|uniref:phosphate ABC transporter substrate-binding protein PstS n=1 Tax=Desulfobulbus rhabdoformis TaxID=34032 RepID=UPI001966320B|nr:phosphate ABC transporter substrate-binding protein PstS [Desulfobulbus rhabdoformis]